MKCPFKKSVIRKDYAGQKTSVPPHELTETTVDFGECDQRGCAAWNDYKGKCRLIYKENNV